MFLQCNMSHYSIEGDGELFGRDRDSVVGWRTETVPCRGRHLGEEDFLAISVRRLANRATLLSLSIISL